MRYMLLLCAFLGFSVLAQVNESLQREFIELEVRDQKIRSEITNLGWNNVSEKLARKLNNVDKKTQSALRK